MTIARLIPGLGPTPVVNDVPDAKARGDLAWALEAVKAKTNRIRLRDAYYNGDHRLAYATKDWSNEFGKMLKAFNANYCPRVVDTLADRLRLAGVDVTRGDQPWQDGNDALNVVWQRNRMDRRAGAVHTGSLTHGELYVTVWPHPVTEEITYYLARGDRMAVRYATDAPDDIEVAAKVWMEEKRARITLYYPDHVERWATPEERTFTGLPPSVNAFEMLDADGFVVHDYGVVPVVPFLNNPNDGGEGRSELDDIIPLQDALNMSMADMLVALEFASYPQRWGVGLIEQRDPITNKVVSALQAGIERMWTSDNPDSKFGQFAVAEMSNFVAAQDAIRSDIARVSATPLHLMLMFGSVPSGEALEVLESPLMAKVTDRQDTLSPSWEELARITLIEEGAVNAQDRDTTFNARWKDTATKSTLDTAKAVQIRRDLGISEKQGLRELGYEDGKIDEMMAEKETDAGDVANAAMRNFDRGGATGFEE